MPSHAPTQPAPAILVLEDGRTFHGEAFGAEGETFGEAVFNTGMTGYQETLTDPSYHRQVVVMTAPHVGNTGVNADDMESGKVSGRRRKIGGAAPVLLGPHSQWLAPKSPSQVAAKCPTPDLPMLLCRCTWARSRVAS